MGQKYYWNNVTKNIWNENDLGDFLNKCEKGDVIKFTVRGNAIVYDLINIEKDDVFNEYEDVVNLFLKEFKRRYQKSFV